MIKIKTQSHVLKRKVLKEKLLQKKALKKKTTILTSIILSSGLSSSAFAVDVDAGDYTALPAGTNLAMLYYQNASRDELYADGNKLAGDYSLDSNIGILRGVHFTEIGGYTVDPQFLLPFGSLDAGGDVAATLGDESGVGDLVLAATVWLVNKPEDNTYFGITPFLYLPTGSYDADSALNLGENRWKFALQGGYITNLTDNVALDVAADVMLYGDNDDYSAGKKTLEQAASFQLQAYLRYQMNPSWDLRAGVSQSWGGETKVDGVNQDDEAEITKMTLGTAYFVDPTLQLLVNYGRDLDVKNGFKEDNRLNFRILKAF